MSSEILTLPCKGQSPSQRSRQGLVAVGVTANGSKSRKENSSNLAANNRSAVSARQTRAVSWSRLNGTPKPRRGAIADPRRGRPYLTFFTELLRKASNGSNFPRHVSYPTICGNDRSMRCAGQARRAQIKPVFRRQGLEIAGVLRRKDSVQVHPSRNQGKCSAQMSRQVVRQVIC